MFIFLCYVFLFVISYHRQHHRFTLCRQCLVCILMSNTHRAEAVIKKPELLFFFLVYGFKRKGHSIKGGKMLSVLHKKKLQKLWLLRCWLYRIFISSSIFCFCFYNKCNDNLHTLLTKTMSFIVSLYFSHSLFCFNAFFGSKCKFSAVGLRYCDWKQKKNDIINKYKTNTISIQVKLCKIISCFVPIK